MKNVKDYIVISHPAAIWGKMRETDPAIGLVETFPFFDELEDIFNAYYMIGEFSDQRVF